MGVAPDAARSVPLGADGRRDGRWVAAAGWGQRGRALSEAAGNRANVISREAERVGDIDGIDDAFKQIAWVSDEGGTGLRRPRQMLLCTLCVILKCPVLATHNLSRCL